MSVTTAEFQERLRQLQGQPEVRLFVRASITDRNTVGACLICHQWLMVFRYMVEMDLIRLEVVPISYDNEPEDYKCLHCSKRLPAAFLPDLQLAASTPDELEALLAKFQCPQLALPFESKEVLEATHAFIDVYKNVLNFIRNGVESPLLNALKRLEDYLQTQKTRYLLGEKLTFADCMLMPKLQVMRVLLRACKQWDIPMDLVNIWRYVQSMYETTAFTVTCPLDRDILMHYRENKALDIPMTAMRSADDYLHSCPSQLPPLK
ncbi:Chloride intracellular channel protein 5 [Echinococcus granulosus]|uniref:Chloride intracellular channel protein 5 n=2 Tax=Echinococcus granulosus TaxID=6210 RepID=W6V3L5_ECHGR|nr:Chloride intracellular channel protein 5 [Echinococcus granulosus]EUB60614.1 Chloride intracellular channel protein 5 [Echinococcus granulosus]